MILLSNPGRNLRIKNGSALKTSPSIQINFGTNVINKSIIVKTNFVIFEGLTFYDRTITRGTIENSSIGNDFFAGFPKGKGEALYSMALYNCACNGGM